MAFVTLTINTEAHRRLKKLKAPGDSFSDVILRELPEPWQTAGEVLDALERTQVSCVPHPRSAGYSRAGKKQIPITNAKDGGGVPGKSVAEGDWVWQ